MNIDKELIGKTIINAEVDGFGMILTFDDNTTFVYDASDGGYSTYSFENEERS